MAGSDAARQGLLTQWRLSKGAQTGMSALLNAANVCTAEDLKPFRNAAGMRALQK
jgi:hypothetical protein